MAHRTVTWTQISRAGHDARAKVPAGLLSANALVQFLARSRPLITAGRFDRSAIMSAAAKAAKAHQERFGCTWSEAMSVTLKAAWAAAKLARTLARH
ncbi:hypothetical protein [Methylobacterium mesophilicum]